MYFIDFIINFFLILNSRCMHHPLLIKDSPFFTDHIFQMNFHLKDANVEATLWIIFFLPFLSNKTCWIRCQQRVIQIVDDDSKHLSTNWEVMPNNFRPFQILFRSDIAMEAACVWRALDLAKCNKVVEYGKKFNHTISHQQQKYSKFSPNFCVASI